MCIPCTKDAPCKLLFVEDNDATALVYTEALKHLSDCGFTTTIIGTLKGALDLLKHNTYDVVLLDLGLPDNPVDDVQPVDSIITQTQERVPIVVLTGNDDRELGYKAIRHGAQSFIVKSGIDGVDAERLCDIIRHAILRNPRRVRWIDLCSFLQKEIVGLEAIRGKVKSDPDMAIEELDFTAQELKQEIQTFLMRAT